MDSNSSSYLITPTQPDNLITLSLLAVVLVEMIGNPNSSTPTPERSTPNHKEMPVLVLTWPSCIRFLMSEVPL